MSEKIAVITLMRKGSKRFPGKNIAPLLGEPLYVWTVNTGIDLANMLGCNYYLAHDYDNLRLPEEVCEIKREARFAGDAHRTGEEIASLGLGADIYILLQVTSPFRDISRMMSWVCHFTSDLTLGSGFAAKKLTGYIYTRLGEDAFPMNFMQQERTDNGCHKYEYLKETGSFYIFRKRALGMKHILDAAPKRIYEDSIDVDIDTPEDLRRTERI